MTKRRDFIKTSLVGATELTIGGMVLRAKPYRSIIGSNDQIRVAAIGTGSDSEKFVNDPEADATLTRRYREPYVVPDKI